MEEAFSVLLSAGEETQLPTYRVSYFCLAGKDLDIAVITAFRGQLELLWKQWRGVDT